MDDKNPAGDNGRTALHEAASKGKYEVCRLIMENVKDKNPAADNGRTPLHEATTEGHLEICKYILENVEDKNPADIEGITPKNIARTNNLHDIMNLFKIKKRKVHVRKDLLMAKRRRNQ